MGTYQLRRGTTVQWASPIQGVPKAGELVYNTTTRRMTIGDGTLAEADLPTIGGDVVRVSEYVPWAVSNKAAIESAITAAGADSSQGVVDFESVDYITEDTVTVDEVGVILINGGIVPTGQFPAMEAIAADVTVRNMTFSRSTAAGFADSLADRACVTVGAVRFRSFDCNYLAANAACVYLTHGTCDGALIRGGEMTGTDNYKGACGVYAAAGSTGNRNITVDGVHMHDMPMGAVLFDTGYSTVKNCLVEHLRILPTINLTGWTVVSGNVYRQRTAAGTPGTTGAPTDREDGDTRVLTSGGTTRTEVTGTSPGTNQWSIDGGYVYLNLGGTDPNTVTVTSGIVSGYGMEIYVTGTGGNEPLACHNKFVNNHIEDVDGIGIYFQLGYGAGAVGNQAIGNTLKSVCLEGIQLSALPFAGIGVNGGNDTLIMGGSIDTIGSGAKTAPGVDILPGAPGGVNADPSGRIVGLVVRNGLSHGYQVRASNWVLQACRSLANGGHGYRVWSNESGAIVENVELAGCEAAGSTLGGAYIDGASVGSGYVSARVIGGSYHNNAQRGVTFNSSTGTSNLKDSAVVGAVSRQNGVTSFAQVHVRGACLRTLVDDCTLVSTQSGALGLIVDSQAVDTQVGANHYSLTTPETLNTPVRHGNVWRYTGSPEGVIAAPVGSLYRRADGGAGTTLYVKESGTGNTGWVAK